MEMVREPEEPRSMIEIRQEAPMRKSPVLSVVVVLLLFAGSVFVPSHAQAPAKEDASTFYRLVPGTYVNGWPRFTIHYPKDWVERPPGFAGGNVFAVSSPNSVRYPQLVVALHGYGPGMEKADFALPYLKSLGYRDVTVVSDKPSRLRDGTPAWEYELRMVINGIPAIQLGLQAKRGDVLITAAVLAA